MEIPTFDKITALPCYVHGGWLIAGWSEVQGANYRQTIIDGHYEDIDAVIEMVEFYATGLCDPYTLNDNIAACRDLGDCDTYENVRVMKREGLVGLGQSE